MHYSYTMHLVGGLGNHVTYSGPIQLIKFDGSDDMVAGRSLN
jgi:hypothetical protein